MTTILMISGHGENRNGSFDPGALGYISKGEHKYYEQDFFPALKKYLPKDSNVVLFSEYNVYDYKNLVTLADKYGKDTVVIEMHYDAGSSSASGGHVIVHSTYAPDKYDLAIRDVIAKHIGVRYEHKGHKGISGRDNLGNCNRAKAAGLNYRLVELGFGTNKKDADTMVNNVDAIAKDFVEALIGKSNDKPVVVNKPVAKPVAKPKPVAKSIETLVAETKAGKHGNGDVRKKKLGSNYDAVMDIINGKNKPKAVTKKFNLPDTEYWVKKPQFSGSGVLVVQNSLSSIYFYPNKGAKNNGCDSYYGKDTANAVKRFQSVNGLLADGVYGDDTRKKLDKLVNK